MSETIRLLQFTDPHLFAERTGEMRGARTFETLRATLREARDSRWPPHAILVTGDIAQDESRGAYRNFRDCFADLGVPVHCLPGNHDNPGFMREILGDEPFGYCETFEAGNWLVPLLDTHADGDAGGRLADGQLEKLAKILANAPDRHVMVCLHHHPVSSGSRWLDTVALRNAAELWAILERHDNVRCLLWGHVHQAFQDRRDGIVLLATPSTCRQFRPNVVDFVLDEGRPPAFRWLELAPDGTIETGVHWCHAGLPA